MVDLSELGAKSCPFCGARPGFVEMPQMAAMGRKRRRIVCSNERCEIRPRTKVRPDGKLNQPSKELLEVWNKRA